ncbi:MAG: hypothetical protein HY056_03510 [Proteobacteria bacterium]|nr:hypothetical protein [Pseudomonadota bacterium]
MRRCVRRMSTVVIVPIILLGAAGCSDIYYDRRETIHRGADDAVATNRVTHMYDPWPAASGNREIPGHGPRVAGAIERYRTNRIVQPRGTGTSSVGYAQNAPAPTAAPAASDPGTK